MSTLSVHGSWDERVGPWSYPGPVGGRTAQRQNKATAAMIRGDKRDLANEDHYAGRAYDSLDVIGEKKAMSGWLHMHDVISLHAAQG